MDHLGVLIPPDSVLGRMAGKHMRVRGALLAQLGDWAWCKMGLGLCGWRGEGPSKRICWLCLGCLGGDYPAFDFRSEARWRTALFDMRSHWAQTFARDAFVSAIWGIPGFALGHCKIDWMHACCLGVLQYTQGSALWECFESLGGTMRRSSPACAKLLLMIRSMSKELAVDSPVSDLTVGMFRPALNKSPKLKLEAAEGRRFLPMLRRMLSVCFSFEDPHSSARFSCLDNLLLCYREMDAWVDGGVSKSNLSNFGKRNLLLYSELRRQQPEGSMLWR